MDEITMGMMLEIQYLRLAEKQQVLVEQYKEHLLASSQQAAVSGACIGMVLLELTRRNLLLPEIAKEIRYAPR